MSDTAKRLHCLRPLSDAPRYAPIQLKRGNTTTQGPRADAVSRALIHILRDRTGRGPTRVRTDLSPDLAIVTLEDWLTTAERTLVSEGHRELVTEFRTALHDGMRAEAVAAVEEITGREVAAYLSAHEPPHMAIIAFHLSPAADPTEDR